MARRRDSVKTYPKTFADAENLLDGKSRKVIDHNTVLDRIDADLIGISLHGHAIVSFRRDGRIYARHAGYVTPTTRSRLNACGIRAYIKAGTLRIGDSYVESSFSRVDRYK